MPDNQKCFAGSQTNMVTMANGAVKYVDDIKPGDKVKVMTDDGTIADSEVHVLSHSNPDTEGDFFEINSETKRVTLSNLHYLKVIRNGEAMSSMAKDVKVDDDVFTIEDDKLKMEKVMSIEIVQGKGIFAPFTLAGTLIVNGIAVSCYSTVKPEIAHKLALPLRMAYTVTPTPVMSIINTCNNDGKPYVMAAASRLAEPFITR